MRQHAGSRLEINIDMDLRSVLKERIDKADLSVDMFDRAERHCLDLLRFSVFPLWKDSFGFKDLLKKSRAKDLEELRQLRTKGKNLPRAHPETHTIEMEAHASI